MKMTNKNKIKKQKPNKVLFQSDIVINDEGEILISFFGPELLHLVNRSIDFGSDRTWCLPADYEKLDHSLELQKIKNEYRECKICPKECSFDRVQSAHPNCGDWNLKVSNFGISFGDEPEISNGGGSGLLFLSGCPLTCPSCINEEKVRSDDQIVSLNDFLKMCEKLYQNGANNLQILSPTVYLPHLRFFLKILKDFSFPLPIILKSSGYELVEYLAKFEGLVDIYLPDYKFSSSNFWKKESGASDYHEVFIESLNEMYRQVGGIVKNDKGIITSYDKACEESLSR
jgi:putative pyruvate formate lyase activating enzyme